MGRERYAIVLLAASGLVLKSFKPFISSQAGLAGFE